MQLLIFCGDAERNNAPAEVAKMEDQNSGAEWRGVICFQCVATFHHCRFYVNHNYSLLCLNFSVIR